MKRHAALFWLTAYLLAVCIPMLVLLWLPLPAKAGAASSAGLALGFAGLTMLALQFLITARLGPATAPFGVDLVYYFHRWLAYALTVIVLAHPLALLLDETNNATRLLALGSDPVMLSGWLALLLLVLVIITSVFRKTLRLNYETWRLIHLLLSLATVAMAWVHMRQVNYLSAQPLVNLLWTTIAFSVVIIVLYVRLLRPWLLTLKPWKVTHVTEENGDCTTLTLRPEGHAGLSFQAGQFVWLSLGHSPFAMREHPFSIASAPQSDGSLELTIKALGDFSSAVKNTPINSTAFVDGPYGVFVTERYPDARGFIFVGGGIGMAPILGMLKSLATKQDTRPLVLFTAHSEWQRIPRVSELLPLQQALNLHIVSAVEIADANQQNRPWPVVEGWLNKDLLQQHLPADLPADLRGFHVFMCGPLAMTERVEHWLRQLGVPIHHIHTELFDMV